MAVLSLGLRGVAWAASSGNCALDARHSVAVGLAVPALWCVARELGGISPALQAQGLGRTLRGATEIVAALAVGEVAGELAGVAVVLLWPAARQPLAAAWPLLTAVSAGVWLGLQAQAANGSLQP